MGFPRGELLKQIDDILNNPEKIEKARTVGLSPYIPDLESQRETLQKYGKMRERTEVSIRRTLNRFGQYGLV